MREEVHPEQRHEFRRRPTELGPHLEELHDAHRDQRGPHLDPDRVGARPHKRLDLQVTTQLTLMSPGRFHLRDKPCSLSIWSTRKPGVPLSSHPCSGYAGLRLRMTPHFRLTSRSCPPRPSISKAAIDAARDSSVGTLLGRGQHRSPPKPVRAPSCPTSGSVGGGPDGCDCFRTGRKAAPDE